MAPPRPSTGAPWGPHSQLLPHLSHAPLCCWRRLPSSNVRMLSPRPGGRERLGGQSGLPRLLDSEPLLHIPLLQPWWGREPAAAMARCPCPPHQHPSSWHMVSRSHPGTAAGRGFQEVSQRDKPAPALPAGRQAMAATSAHVAEGMLSNRLQTATAPRRTGPGPPGHVKVGGKMPLSCKPAPFLILMRPLPAPLPFTDSVTEESRGGTGSWERRLRKGRGAQERGSGVERARRTEPGEGLSGSGALLNSAEETHRAVLCTLCVHGAEC